MTESQLKAKLLSRLRKEFRSWIIIAHHERTTHGVPDISVTSEMGTFWIEVKLAKPRLMSKGIQDVTCAKMELVADNCFYLIFFEGPNDYRETIITRPSIVQRDEWLKSYEVCVKGFDIEAAVEWCRQRGVAKDAANG